MDGKVAGVAFPFPVIFTGGFNPAVWRPITAYGAIDLPTYFLDLTPFVPVFADGLPHVVTIDVVSAESTHHINENWFVSGLLQVITDPSGEPTTGRMLVYDVEPYATTHISGSVNPSEVVVTVEAERHVFIESVVVSGSGVENYVAFRQDLFYANTQLYGDDATVQVRMHVVVVVRGSLTPLSLFRPSIRSRLGPYHRFTTMSPSSPTISHTLCMST